MKVLHTKTLKDGRRHVLMELSPHEKGHFAYIMPDAFYRLNEPMHEDIVIGHIIQNPQRVYWDSLEQKWIDA
ncbi:hypothetical protein UFOVP228_24 [uncultured Caudovirales phage]|uniref:Uncharacterized protein n=1 Tax=uncultured Caudovirales phage TaxID=2100421 RepID=A0A6J7WMP1_9CAUD|nr:hypothetical protein UFOVP47_78 [uncultured Caudovirales phage]CAB5219090.1 hypothetical protein UFOVP228_24 [uncultured Caudovirales phage]